MREGLNLKPGREISIAVQGEPLVMKRMVRNYPDWRSMRGMAREGESPTKLRSKKARPKKPTTMPRT